MDIELRPVLFVGAGNLAWSLVNGLLAGDCWQGHRSGSLTEDPGRLGRFAALGLRTGRDLAELTEGAGTVILATKPQDAATALNALAPYLTPRQLVVSAVAGLPLGRLRSALGTGRAWSA